LVASLGLWALSYTVWTYRTNNWMCYVNFGGVELELSTTSWDYMGVDYEDGRGLVEVPRLAGRVSRVWM
jgi:hypothetical protein